MASVGIAIGINAAVAPATGLYFVGLILACIAGGLFPDIDHPNSFVGRRIRPVSLVIRALFRHRGVIHSLLGAAICSATLMVLRNFYPFPPEFVLYFTAGYIGHLLCDCTSRSGVRLFWPFSLKVRIPAFGSGAKLILISLLLVFIILMANDVEGFRISDLMRLIHWV